MAAAKKAESEPTPDLVVSVPFAYATTKSGEVKQLLKGDLVFADQYKAESIDHLKSIGFLSES